jgi:hypothetical protein
MVPRLKAPALVLACSTIGLALGVVTWRERGPHGPRSSWRARQRSAPQFLTTALVPSADIRFISRRRLNRRPTPSR